MDYKGDIYGDAGNRIVLRALPGRNIAYPDRFASNIIYIDSVYVPSMMIIGTYANIMHKCSQNMVKAQVMNAKIKKTKNKYFTNIFIKEDGYYNFNIKGKKVVIENMTINNKMIDSLVYLKKGKYNFSINLVKI